MNANVTLQRNFVFVYDQEKHYKKQVSLARNIKIDTARMLNQVPGTFFLEKSHSLVCKPFFDDVASSPAITIVS